MVEALRVPTEAVEAELLLRDGRTIRGRVFVPASSSNYSGPKRVDDWIEEPEDFFPFLAEDDAAPAIYAKEAVVALTVPPPEPREDEPASEGVERRVVLECAASRHEGVVLIELPAHQRRVLDYMNHRERFVCLRGADRMQMVLKSAIVRVLEPGD